MVREGEDSDRGKVGPEKYVDDANKDAAKTHIFLGLTNHIIR